tara:strand:- start:6764 stop:7648 length:885 start_codon:yes stop_codon:yes gene_type:complete
VITFSQLGHYGRLGNQLFQFAMLKSVALERGYQLKIPNPDNIILQGQPCQLKNFNIKCDFLTDSDYRNIRFRFMEPNHSVFWRQVFDVNDNTDFAGYFQSYLYFKKFEKQIKEDFKFNSELQGFANDYVNNLKTNNEKIVSVHFRRGDNVDGTFGRHSGLINNYFGKGDRFSENSFFGRFLNESIKIFDDNCKFLVFSGGTWKGMNDNQTDIDWCKENIKDDRFIFCEGNNDLEDFAIMTNCDHNIVSHSTSFGYWSAFLNPNPDKVIVAPKIYSIPDDGRVQKGFYPEAWRLV